MTMKLARERVAKGAERLEEKRPGWRDMINENSLDMDDVRYCVLGQVYYEDFRRGALELFGPEWDWRVLQLHGFEADPGEGTLCGELETAWLELLHPATA